MQAVAERLDEGLLARPAMEEPQRPVARVEREVRLVLAAGEESRRDPVRVAQFTDSLHVDADLAAAREGVQRHIPAVRHVEAQVGLGEAAGEPGLSARPIVQLDQIRARP